MTTRIHGPVKPMLAIDSSKIDLEALRWPMLASPKIDGIRGLVVNGVVQSRSGKPIPCPTVQAMFGREEYNGLDGELALGPINHPNLMQRSMRLMGKQPLTEVELLETPLTFNVFDLWGHPAGYAERLDIVLSILDCSTYALELQMVGHVLARGLDEVAYWENLWLEEGFEGLMLNDRLGMYKHGRSGKRNPELIKVKRFVDEEFLIVGALELMHNANELQQSELGYAKRSSAKAGKRPGGMLGALQCVPLSNPVVEPFEVGAGFTEDMRRQLWDLHQKGELAGNLATVKHFAQTGVVNKPRIPVFRALRSRGDLSC